MLSIWLQKEIAHNFAMLKSHINIFAILKHHYWLLLTCVSQRLSGYHAFYDQKTDSHQRLDREYLLRTFAGTSLQQFAETLCYKWRKIGLFFECYNLGGLQTSTFKFMGGSLWYL